MEDEEKEKERAKAWDTNRGQQTGVMQEAVEETDSEEVDELIDLQFARPPKDEFDCESICSTYSNMLNHPKLITYCFLFSSN